MCECGKLNISGRGAAWLARLLGVQEVPGSNPGGPTSLLKNLDLIESLSFPHNSRTIPHFAISSPNR